MAKHLICGDFNIVPEAIDGWRGEKGEGTIFYTKEERQHLQDFVDLGLIDLFRNRYPDSQEFSFGGTTEVVRFIANTDYALIFYWQPNP